MMYNIGQLASQFGLSRSTLLYYDRKGLLTPSTRTRANYRAYSDSDLQRLKKIMTYRETGLSLSRIGELLGGEGSNRRTELLSSQLDLLNQEIASLRKQQHVILDLLGNDAITRSTRSMSKKQWVKLLAASGMSDDEMDQWHVEFERRMPQAHQDFLESLNIPKAQIRQIRKQSRNPA